ncbi:MAG: hypothetical protein WEE66_12810 [Actinomycetota bacterium]
MDLPEKELQERNLQLREEVQRAAGRQISDEGWEFFVEKEAADDEPFSRHLVDLMLEQLPYYSMVGRRPPSRRIMQPAPNETIQAYEDALAWFASRTPSFSVERFRASVVGRKLVTPSEARDWLNDRLEAEGLERGLPASYRHLVSVPKDSLLPVMEVQIVELRDPVDGLDYWAPVLPGESDANWLRLTAKNWAADVGCTNGMATLWVISGVTPSVEMVSAVFHPAAPTKAFGERIELTVDPATPPEDVMLAYKKARTAIAGGRVRTPTSKHLRLAVFADQKPAGEKWVETMRRWNDAYPAWEYEYVPNFWRDCDRALKRFLKDRPFTRGEE